MRKKIILIQGSSQIANQLVIPENSIINTDQVILITTLKYPQSLPDGFVPSDPACILSEIIEVFEHLCRMEMSFLVYSEYANMMLDREIQAVEGLSMNVPFLYNTVRMFHKNMGQTVVEVVTEETKWISINGTHHSWQEGLSLLVPRWT